MAAVLFCQGRASGKPAEPVRPPSRADVVGMLHDGRFEELDRRFSKIQAGYKSGEITDVELRAAFQAFYSTEAALEPRYGAWVAKYPKSYVAHLAFGIYSKKLGEASRGGDTIDKTSESQLAGMEAAFKTAMREFQVSASLDSRPLLSYVYEMSIANYLGDDRSMRENFALALKADPGNVIARQRFMVHLEPIWGGSDEQMADFLDASRKSGLSPARLQTIEAVVIGYEAQQDAAAGNLESAESKYRKAIAFGLDGCRACLGEVLTKEQKYDEAIEVLSRALDADPDDVHARFDRAFCYLNSKKFQPAFADFLIAAEAGDAISQHAIGSLYMTGLPDGIPANQQEGIRWLRKAAAQGDARAIASLKIAVSQYPAAAAASN